MRQTTRRKVTKTKKNGAKVYSKYAMLFASFWLVIATVLKDIFGMPFTMSDILTVAVSIVGIWTPTFVSIWIDKITTMITEKGNKITKEV